MSSETLESQRSIFESKSRNELIDIAFAMGGRPPARIRKAELVDLIVGLAGFGEGGGDGSGDGSGDGRSSDTGGETQSAEGAKAKGANLDTDVATRAVDAGEQAEPRTEGVSDTSADPMTEIDGSRRSGAGAASENAAAATPAVSGGTSASDRAAPPYGRGEATGVPRAAGSKASRAVSPPVDGQSEDASDAASRRKASSTSIKSARTPDRTDESRMTVTTKSAATRTRENIRTNEDTEREQQEQRNTVQELKEQRERRDAPSRNDRNRREDFNDAGNRRRRRGGRGRDEDLWEGDLQDVSGYLDLRDEGYGFLRINAQTPSRDDIYVSMKQVRQWGMRKGDHVTGASRPGGRSEKNPPLLRLDSINHMKPEESKNRPKFEELTPLFPDEKLRLERDGDTANMTTRIIDLLSPIGKGQRGLIVSPPKAGKTTIMKEVARSIETNNPECMLLVLLVDERPEEVTDMRRWLKRGEVAASTFDRPAEEHTQVAELTIERAKRQVEMGEDVVIMLDGITRLARAYNLAAPATGRIMSGGVDSGALYPPKKFFGAARNMEEGGSLTILATALVETGSKMDEVIFEEFKGTGNMELRLDRRSAERRIYPAINVDSSSTRHEELLFERRQLQQVWKLRRVLSGLASDHGGNGAAGLELLIDRLKTFPNNNSFLEEVARGPMGD